MLPKKHRLNLSKDFEKVTKNGVKVNTEIALIYAIANPLTQTNSQIGLIVSNWLHLFFWRLQRFRLPCFQHRIGALMPLTLGWDLRSFIWAYLMLMVHLTK